MRSISNSIRCNFWRYFLVFIGAWGVSVHLRTAILAGKTLGADYNFQPPVFSVLLVAAAVIASGLQLRPLLALPGIALAAALLFPDISQLQLIYFGITGIGLSWLAFPAAPYRRWLIQLWQRRALVRLWLVYNIRSRYSQTILGIVWIVLLPLTTSLILAVIFSQILHPHSINDKPFVSFFLSGVTFWMLFQQGMTHSTSAILSKGNVISHFHFPLEILVLVKLGETLVDAGFTFAALLVVNALNGIYPNPNYLHLLPLLLAYTFLMLGLMLFISAACVFVRDLPRLVDVLLQLLFYATPIIYPPNVLPGYLHWLITLNPLAGFITSYRAIILYNQAPNYSDLVIPIVFGSALTFASYRYFKQHEKKFADYV